MFEILLVVIAVAHGIISIFQNDKLDKIYSMLIDIFTILFMVMIKVV